MTTRELINTIREQATGNEEFNALLNDCANRIEEFLGGPEREESAAIDRWVAENPEMFYATSPD